jgi:hypothetical protein
MKSILTAIGVTIMMTSLLGAKEAPKSFTTLAEAVQFISGTLEQSDYKGLKQSVTGKKQFSEGAFESLKKVHHDTPLTELYKGREFPDSAAYSIGGHQSELGHINIDFVQKKKWFSDQKKWFIDAIWVCR